MTNVNAPGELPATASALLACHRLFIDTPEDVLELVVDGAFEARRAAREYFFRDGEPASHYLLVREGQVEMVRVAIDGQERLANVFGPGSLVAEAAMFMAHGLYPMSARAAGAASALCLRRDRLKAACLRRPELALRLLEALSGRLYRTVNEVSALATASAPQRLAAISPSSRVPKDRRTSSCRSRRTSSPATSASGRKRSAASSPSGRRKAWSSAAAASGS